MIHLKHAKCRVRPIKKDFDTRNPQSTVQQKTKKAFEELRKGNWKIAIETLAGENGLYCVAEATATAILCFVDPLVAYASDEVLESVNGCERDYTKDSIIGTNKALIDKAKALNLNAKDDLFEWTPHAIGKALYACAAMNVTTNYGGKAQDVMQDLINQVNAPVIATASSGKKKKRAMDDGDEKKVSETKFQKV